MMQMMRNSKKDKNQGEKMQGQHRGSRRVWRVIFVLACFVFMGVTGCGNEIAVPEYDDEPEPVSEISAFAVVSNIDEVNGKITLKEIHYSKELTLSYNGGADVRDKYGDVLAMNQVELGTVADIVYDEGREKLVSLYVSGNEKVQKMEHISGAEVDKLDNKLKINGQSYRMSDNVTAFSENTEIQVDEICSEDQISVWFYNDIVCSIYVELGHGYLKLTDYAGYMGGTVEVGYDVIVPVTEDMLLTVREGEYVLRIEKGEDVGTKKVKVVRNQELTLSLADIAIEPKQMGSVMFQVTPGDAAVYIDGKRVNTEGALELTYGKHSILIQADGYESYRADFNVKYAYKVKEYTLTPSDGTTEENAATKANDTAQSTQEASYNTTTQADAATTQAASDKTESGGTTEKNTESSTDSEADSKKGDNKETANKVIISSPSGASVYFDGEYVGVAPISFKKVTGNHIITFSRTGYLSKSYSVTFTDDGKDTTLNYDALTSISSLLE